MKLKDKVAIVTGGAKGIGLGIVQTFLKYGAQVIIIDNDSVVLEVEKFYQGHNYPVKAYNVDIREKEQVDEITKEVFDVCGKIDILINNAGVCNLSSFDLVTDEDRDFHFDVNIKGSWNLCKSTLPYMKEKNYGKIINISSITGPKVSDFNQVAYATTKAAIIGFTKSLAREFAQSNINVNAICPGYIETPMVLNIAKQTNEENPNEVLNEIKESIPFNKLGTPTDVGELAAFLASEESSYITGQEIIIDGGLTLPETKLK